MQLQSHLQESFVDEFRWAYDSSRDGFSDGQPNSTLALPPTTLVAARPTAKHHVASLSELRLTKHSIFWGLAGSHPHADSGKNMGFLAPAYPRPPFAAACGGADNDGPLAVVTTFEPYPTS